jgi:hypothetical protein
MEVRVEKKTLNDQNPKKVDGLRLNEKLKPIPWIERPTGALVVLVHSGPINAQYIS